MADRTRGARAVTSLADLARTLVGRPAATPAAAATALVPVAPRRLIEDPGTFFGPGQPLPAVAPEAAGRAFDYPFAYNTSARPRSTEPVTFDQLRRLADAHDLTRLAIETRKNQLKRQNWTLARRDGSDTAPPPQVLDFFRRPDQRLTWRRWLGAVVEEMLVIDALALYYRRTRGGALWALEQIDGATIVPLLDAGGRRPSSPAPAYQQVLKGMPAVPYTTDELLYAPINPRVHRVYGYSPVEQILVTINLALRRQTHQLAYYTDGNIPDLLMAVPETWGPQQLKELQLWFDTVMSSDTVLAERRKLKFVPGGTDPKFLQTHPLFDEGDEWLARVVQSAFSLPPTPYVRMMNRATSQTSQDAAEDEGLSVLKQDVKDVLDYVLQAPEGLGLADWEFTWTHDEDVDGLKQAQIDQIYVTIGARTPKEVALDRFGAYTAPEPADDTLAAAPAAPGATGTTPPAATEAAKAAGRSLRRY